MLNERERRELGEIEAAMLEADPSFGTLFRGGGSLSRRHMAVLVAIVSVLATLAVGLILLGLVLQAVVVLAIGAWPALVLRDRSRQGRGGDAAV